MTDMVMEKQEQKVSFGARNANDERIKEEEQELAELQKRNTESKPEDNNEEPTNAEERSFKKRYGDLRRHTQQLEGQFKKQIEDLQRQLQQSTTKQIELPKSEEELAEWAATYPDVARIVETIAIKKAKEQTQALDARFKELDEREKLSAREKAEVELLQAHPDFITIRDSDEFHEWAEEQPKWVQNALYENDTDARAASRAIDLYKADKKISKTKSSSNKTAAESVNTRSSRSGPSDNNDSDTFYESVVDKMTSYEYEANQEAIAKAIRSGKFIYDKSGKAR
jgi:hypothetical protein